MSQSDLPFDVAGKKVLVTGAGRGIGRGIGEVLAESGADVAMNALTPKYLDKAVDEIAELSGRSVVAVVGDAATADGAHDVVTRAIEQLGGLDALVNGVGDALQGPLGVPRASAEQPMDDNTVDLAMNLNLMSAIHCVRAAGTQFLTQGSGSVINIASAVAAHGGANLAIYTAAKTGLVAFTRATALEWAPHVRVNAIAPGVFPDPRNDDPDRSAMMERIAANIPLRRTGDVREVGHLARFLLSPAGSYLTGQAIFIDGGMSIR
jgi:3-oxoacyl-[acyl-carrier protein] reductase